MEAGKSYDIYLNPSRLVNWTFVRETKKCYVMKKESDGHEILVPKKTIKYTEERKDGDKKV